MPTLNWIGKDRIINHHQEVPFRTLEKQYGFKKTEGEVSKIIQGDNLEALKALLPQYENRVKCIYIDPPYNTGNEGWVYNDNVNDPRLKKWLGQVVGKEAEDLSRHDKWLCMMYPRLKFLHKLLADDGAIFISIDDNEQANLKLIMDEIFGARNFVAPLIWRSRKSVDARTKTGVSNDHEYILVYKKNEFEAFKGVEKDLEKFNNPDNDSRGSWRSADLTGLATKSQRPNLHYELTDPKTGIIYLCPEKGWRYDPKTMRKKIEEGRVIFPLNGTGRPRNKIFMDEMASQSKAVSSVILDINTGDGTRELSSLLGNDIFSFPKPSSLIEFLISQISTNPNDIILDSFAGSGTTAHAVLNLNKADGGNRQFILVQIDEIDKNGNLVNIAETITAERVRRVIDGYGNTEGTGGSFDFYTLGEALFDEQGNLNAQAKIEVIKEYIWFTETRSSFVANHSSNNESGTPPEQTSFLGTHNETDYYFGYDPNQAIILDMDLLATITQKASQYLIYADSCELSEEFLNANNIIFKKIPRDITRL